MVRYDGTDLGQLKQENMISQMVIHQDFDPNSYQNDLCLIRLQNTVEFSLTVNKIDLAKREPILGLAEITGWGRTRGYDQDSMPNKLQLAKMMIYPRLVCTLRYPFVFKKDMICAGSILASGCFVSNLIIYRMLGKWLYVTCQ